MRSLVVAIFLTLIAVGNVPAQDRNPDCQKYYFGLGVQKDPGLALKNCQGDADAEILLLILLNGEGTPVDLDRAQAIVGKLAAAERKDGWGPDMTLQHFMELIRERRKHPDRKAKRLDYGNIAMTTYDMNYYANIKNRLKQQELNRQVAKQSVGLSAPQIKALKKVNDTFESLVKLSRNRMYLNYIDGSIRGIAGGEYANYMRDRHLARVSKWRGPGSWPTPGEFVLSDVDQELNMEFKKMRLGGELRLKEMAKRKSPDTEDFKAYGPTLRDEQRNWIKYRDAWVAFAELLVPVGASNRAALLETLKAALTKERVDELTFDSGA